MYINSKETGKGKKELEKKGLSIEKKGLSQPHHEPFTGRKIKNSVLKERSPLSRYYQVETPGMIPPYKKHLVRYIKICELRAKYA